MYIYIYIYIYVYIHIYIYIYKYTYTYISRASLWPTPGRLKTLCSLQQVVFAFLLGLKRENPY